MIGVTLNGIACVGVGVSIPGVGAWTASVDLDLGLDGIVPSGRAVLTIGTDTLVGTIDARATGRFGTKARVELVGGGGGWDRNVPALHLHNDAGVTTAAVFATTAAAVGEAVVDPVPRVLGVDYVRCAGPASRVLAGVAWYVDAAGVTQIGTRLPLPLPAGVDVLEWEPATKRAKLAFDGLVWPGAVLVDTRFGTATIRDVQADFGADGARTIAWCETGSLRVEETSGNRLARALGAAAIEATRAAYVRCYRYRVVLQGVDGRLTLQAVARTEGAPDLIAVPSWHGVAGVTHTLAPATVVLVAFIAGDASRPIVVGFDPDAPAPTKTTIRATRVDVGAGTSAVVLGTTKFATWVTAITSAVNGLAPGSAIAPIDFKSTKLFSE